jgi:hypothetical protein
MTITSIPPNVTPDTVTIFTISCTQPVYIEAQHKAFQKYIKVPYKFVVLNVAKDWPDNTNFGDTTMPNRIQDICQKLEIDCIRFPHEQHRSQSYNASARHRDTLNIIMEYIRKYPGKYWLIDSDMWPIADITAEDFDRYFEKAGSFVIQVRDHYGTDVIYAWANIWWIDSRNVDVGDLSWDFAPSCDVGGASQYWVKKNSDDLKWLSYYRSLHWTCDDIPESLKNHPTLLHFFENDPRNKEKYANIINNIHETTLTTMHKNPQNRYKLGGWYWCELFDEKIIHMLAGSNWNGEGKQIHDIISELVRKCFIDV